MNELTGYALSKFFWDFAFENTGKIKPIHIALYFFAIEHCNRLGWKKQFGLPTSMVLEAITVKSYSVYKSAFDDLVEYGFFEVVQYSKNQYSSNIIALKENSKANSKALSKALSKHASKQGQSTTQSTVSIDKPITNKPITSNTYDEITFSIFQDHLWIEQVKITHKGKDLNQAWNECYLHHSQSISPPQELWEWRQKFNTWLSIKKQDFKKEPANKYKVQ